MVQLRGESLPIFADQILQCATELVMELGLYLEAVLHRIEGNCTAAGFVLRFDPGQFHAGIKGALGGLAAALPSYTSPGAPRH
jgi:hypothetical protein